MTGTLSNLEMKPFIFENGFGKKPSMTVSVPEPVRLFGLTQDTTAGIFTVSAYVNSLAHLVFSGLVFYPILYNRDIDDMSISVLRVLGPLTVIPTCIFSSFAINLRLVNALVDRTAIRNDREFIYLNENESRSLIVDKIHAAVVLLQHFNFLAAGSASAVLITNNKDDGDITFLGYTSIVMQVVNLTIAVIMSGCKMRRI